MFSKGIIAATVLVNVALYTSVQSSETVESHRSRRQLLFPNSTLLQLNIGVGTPTPIKTINVNWAFQANFQLPWNRSQIPVDIFGANSGYVGTAKKKRDVDSYEPLYESDAKLYHFYKYVEDILNGFGHRGDTCVLRALCQLASEPLEPVSDEDLLHEIATYVLNPLNDITGDDDKESAPYVRAYHIGRERKDCVKIYRDCTMSLIDIFTRLQ